MRIKLSVITMRITILIVITMRISLPNQWDSGITSDWKLKLTFNFSVFLFRHFYTLPWRYCSALHTYLDPTWSMTIISWWSEHGLFFQVALHLSQLLCSLAWLPHLLMTLPASRFFSPKSLTLLFLKLCLLVFVFSPV